MISWGGGCVDRFQIYKRCLAYIFRLRRRRRVIWLSMRQNTLKRVPKLNHFGAVFGCDDGGLQMRRLTTSSECWGLSRAYSPTRSLVAPFSKANFHLIGSCEGGLWAWSDDANTVNGWAVKKDLKTCELIFENSDSENCWYFWDV